VNYGSSCIVLNIYLFSYLFIVIFEIPGVKAIIVTSVQCLG